FRNDAFYAGGGHDSMTGGTQKNLFQWNEGDGPLDIMGSSGTNTLQVLGSSTGDAFQADASGAKLVVKAAGGGPIQPTNIQYLVMDDSAGGNRYTIDDLAGTGIQHIYLNTSEVARANGPADHIFVNGSMATANTVVVSANPNVQGIVSNDPTASGQATDV